MEKTGRAYFVPHPRRIEDLRAPHPISNDHPYRVVKTITLGVIDYENFTTDMLADRQFIEENHELCGEGEEWRCLLVKCRSRTGGVLVMPEAASYAGWAAYIE